MNRAFALGLLVVLGAGWGLTQPLAKIAVSEGYRHFGMVFWQFAIGAAILGAVMALRRRPLPLSGWHLRLYLVIAVIGTLLPNAASYEAARFLPSGVISILISMVPIFAFPIALSMGQDRFEWPRLAGLMLGLAGVVLMVGPPAGLPPGAAAVIPLALLAPAFYGLEGNVVARWGTGRADPVAVLFGSSVIGMGLAAPLALATGSWITPALPLGRPDLALIGSASIHAVVYATYIWLIGRTGPVFAALVGYLVTGFGIIWAMAILGESYSGWVWAALVLILAGVTLVRPRPAAAPAAPLAPDDPSAENAPSLLRTRP